MHGSRIILISCVLIHCFIVTSNNWIKYTMNSDDVLIWNITQGIAYLFYPILGWIADVYVSRYKIIKLSFILVLIGSQLMMIGAIERILEPEFKQRALSGLKSVLSIVTLLISIGGIGLYEANAIQFGMQQLSEASSEELSGFIYWYYWSLQLGPVITYYISILIFFYFKNCTVNLLHYKENIHLIGYVMLIPSIFQSVFAVLGLVIMHRSKGKLELHQVMVNPLRKIAQTICYAWRHKHPKQRSAFTYWEDKTPLRIDHGMTKYGGPYSFEEVEDTKTFFQLLLLIFSLFGYFIQSNIHYSSSFIIMNQGCPGLLSFLFLIMNTKHIPQLMTLIGLPVYQFWLRKRISRRYQLPNLMTRIGFGVFLCLVREIANPVLAYMVMTHDSPPVALLECGLHKMQEFMNDTAGASGSSLTLCLLANSKSLSQNNTCEQFCPGLITQPKLFYSVQLLSELISGVSTLLVNLIVLEFICAQSPLSVKGLLIGIWYSLNAIQYLPIEAVNMFLVSNGDPFHFTIKSGVSGLCIFVSLLCYMKVCSVYQYRKRNEVVNEQNMIEEQYERELRYEHEQKKQKENAEQDDIYSSI